MASIGANPNQGCLIWLIKLQFSAPFWTVGKVTEPDLVDFTERFKGMDRNLEYSGQAVCLGPHRFGAMQACRVLEPHVKIPHDNFTSNAINFEPAAMATKDGVQNAGGCRA
ncbi:hypothetical protein [Pseudopelagicola sp. nBUS_19]|mgnify:CR=1 FL=1|uniref:hypothetical protein n=2 Tax=unclassified Pseudopelagicola TaxID=2649563 RepID=UPI003EC0A204